MPGVAIIDWFIGGKKSIIVYVMEAINFAYGKRHINGIESFWSYVKKEIHEVPRHTQNNLTICISKDVNSDSIIGTKIFINLF
jgi:hypothetical protein